MIYVRDFPRRARLDCMCSAELRMNEAIRAIEGLGADVRLSRAQQLIAEAATLVADVIDEQMEARK